MIDPILQARLRWVAAREAQLARWSLLACCWGGAGIIGVALALLQHKAGSYSALSMPAVALLGLVASLLVVRAWRPTSDWKSVARKIELAHTELDGRLLTAVENRDSSEFSAYFHERLSREKF